MHEVVFVIEWYHSSTSFLNTLNGVAVLEAKDLCWPTQNLYSNSSSSPLIQSIYKCVRVRQTKFVQG